MANKITIQHWYTTGSTIAPDGLIEGEIAISHKSGSEAIFLKPREPEAGQALEEIKFIPEVRIKEMFKEAGIGSNDVITGLTSDLKIHMGTEGNTDAKGHVELEQGDLSEITAYTAGHAAASYHEHSQYLEPEQQLGYGFSSVPGLDNGPRKYSVKDGTGITVNESGVSISEVYQNKISSGVTAYREIITHKAVSGGTDQLGHVKLKSGDLSSITAITKGEAAASYHTHGQYLTEIMSSENGISVADPGMNNGTRIISLTTGITNQINSGVTAFNWGDHATKGYAKNDVLTAHTTNGNIHVTPGDKDRWNAAEQNAKAYASGYTNTEIEKVTNRITPLETSANTWNVTTAKFNAFISGGEANKALDTLVEIQNFLSGDTTGVQAMLETISGLTNTVSGNTDDIKTLSGTVSGNTTEITSLKNSKVETIDTVGNLSATVTNLIGNPKKYTIKHTSATTQNSAITATNASTGLNFGDTFEFVNKIGYDANGHVVSGSTQTLKLPIVNQASSEMEGIVTTTSGDLKNYTDIPTKTQLHYAAHRNHTHSQYVRFTDLSANTGNIITISCGTY